MDYNENSFASHLPQPSRIPSPGKLTEVSASAANARSSSMPPPPLNPGTLKRKTLAERAGEPGRPAPVPPGSRSAGAGVKATSMMGLSRQNSYSSSGSSMRNVSNASFSSSTGSLSRPPSAQSHRPQSAMSSSGMRKPTPMSGRPASAFSTHAGNAGTGKRGDRQGMLLFSKNVKERQTHLSESTAVRGSYDSQMNFTSDWSSSAAAQVSPLHPAKGFFSPSRPPKASRDASISTAMSCLSLDATSKESITPPEIDTDIPCTPSHIPRRKACTPIIEESPRRSRSPKKIPHKISFLTRDSNTTAIDWDTQERCDSADRLWMEMVSKMNGATTESEALKSTINVLKENVALYQSRIAETDVMRAQLSSRNESLQSELERAKQSLSVSATRLEDAKRSNRIDLEDLKRQQGRDLDDANRNNQDQIEQLNRQHRDEMDGLRRQLRDAIEEEKARRDKEVQALSTEGVLTQQKVERELDMKNQALQALRDELSQARADLTQQLGLSDGLRTKLSAASTNTLSLEASLRSLRAQVEFLESDSKSQSHAFADLEQKTQDAIRTAAEANEKLRKEESMRRKLHNQVQELKGNIRVFCRVRPTLEPDLDYETARISFPDDDKDFKEVEVMGAEEKSSLGTITTKKNSFTFDRVFDPASQNEHIFEEISQLIQSALDGYNVCIFCYGQTGSGKTHTMSSDDGMISRAVHQIYDTAQSLEEKGWKYQMEGSFVEVYNENLNDLLGKAEEFDKKKHEIRNDMQTCKTTITDVTTVKLDSPATVQSMLLQASANRSVAATKANGRSSRSHSVFILKLLGENRITGEKSEGTLNLVDLAGSERLSHSGSTGERLKETQSINKSLSCLGDVIGALGRGGHVPYRNSKLTHLLQFSLGGNSKTLMFVMISPLQAHISETLTSLNFATKVHNTHIGTARKQTKVRDG